MTHPAIEGKSFDGEKLNHERPDSEKGLPVSLAEDDAELRTTHADGYGDASPFDPQKSSMSPLAAMSGFSTQTVLVRKNTAHNMSPSGSYRIAT